MTQKDFMPPNGESTRNGRSEQGLLDEAKNAASHLASEAKDEASSRVASQKDRAAKSLSSVAEALRGTRHELDDSIPAIGEYADKAADTVQQLSEYIRSKNIGELIDTVEHFARRESALFLGGTAALGLLAGRFLRSSRPANAGGGYDRGYDRGYEREGRDFGGSMNDRNRAYERAGYDRSYGSDTNRPMGGRIGGGSMSGSAYSNTGDMNRSSSSGSMSNTGDMNRDMNRTGSMSSSGSSMGGSSMGSSTSSSMGSSTGMNSGSNIGVQKVGQSSPPAGGQAAQREVTKPGGFTPSTSTSTAKSPSTPAGAGGLTTSSTGQSSNLEEGSAGTGPATGSSTTPKKGSEVK